MTTSLRPSGRRAGGLFGVAPARAARAVAQAPVLLAIALACLFVGGRSCERDVTPQLLEVHEMVPREVEVGDRVALLGAGFPPGKTARVTFRGTLHRPGERPLLGAEIIVPARVVAPERIEIAFDEATQALFSRAGDRATHTTFDGEVEVAFAAAAQGAAPIAGVLEHAVLDVRPSATASMDERDQEGERALQWMGVRAVAGGSGLVLEQVDAGSRAQAAGLAAGDVVTTFDGVRVASAADVVPPPGERAATIQVRRPPEGSSSNGAAESTHILLVDGFRRSPPAELVGAALTVWIALLVVWFFAAPGRPVVAAAVQRVVARLRQRMGGPRSRPWTSGARPLVAGPRDVTGAPRRRAMGAGSLWRALSGVAHEALPPQGPWAIADVVPCALLAAMPFGQYMVAAHLDVGLLFVAAATSLVAAAFVTHRSAWRGALAAASIAWQHVPAAVAVASVVVTTGSLRIQEIEGAQGGLPWDWLAFRSPAGLLALGLLLACMGLEPSDSWERGQGLAALVEEGVGGRPRAGPWVGAACRAHRVLVAGLASVLFLGGWLLPGLGATEQRASAALEIAGAAWLLAKTWALVLAMAWVQWSLRGWTRGAGARATSFYLAPLSMGALVGTAAWTWWGPSPATQLLVSTSLVATVGLAFISLAHRVRHGLTSAAGDGHLSSFL